MAGTVAIITARGGSKRIPRKNIKNFCDKPIIAYSIEAAINSGCFDEVMVSTDDREIAEIAIKYGASVPFMRSAESSNDYASTTDVILEVLDSYKKIGKDYELAACIYPTAPFITAKKLKTAVERLKETGADTVIPVVNFSYPPQRALVINDGKLVFRKPEYMQARSQDLEPWYHDVGQFYILNTEAFVKNKALMAGNIVPMVISELEVQDIDNETDWTIAEMKYKLMKDRENNE